MSIDKTKGQDLKGIQNTWLSRKKNVWGINDTKLWIKYVINWVYMIFWYDEKQGQTLDSLDTVKSKL